MSGNEIWVVCSDQTVVDSLQLLSSLKVVSSTRNPFEGEVEVLVTLEPIGQSHEDLEKIEGVKVVAPEQRRDVMIRFGMLQICGGPGNWVPGKTDSEEG